MTTGEPRWRRLDPDARRDAILERAIELFGRRPYSAVSTAEIARAAGVARGLLNHYFGTKRDLYLAVVRAMVAFPELDTDTLATGPVPQRVELGVDRLLDAVSVHGATFVSVIGAEGVGADPEVERILAEADDLAARAVLRTVGVAVDDEDAVARAVLRAYGGLVKAAIREWLRDGTLTREQVHLLLARALLTIVEQVLPDLSHAGGTEAR